MPTYVIGDVHGCLTELDRLLLAIRFDPRSDRLWFCGDLVNRGPDSLGVLRRVKDLGDRALAVLGNHDIHLLARAEGLGEPKRRDTLDAILEAPDRTDLLSWLRARPLLHREGEWLLVHAGLHPDWTPNEAAALAADAREGLRSERYLRLIDPARVTPGIWHASLRGNERRRYALAVLTRVRTLERDGRLATYSGPPNTAPPGLTPWYQLPHRRPDGLTVLFGHWAALGFHRADRAICLDSGCAWGRSLTAMRLEDGEVTQVAVGGVAARLNTPKGIPTAGG